MKKLITLSFLLALFSLGACNSNKKTDKEIDSLNQAHADSLLNAAMSDTTSVVDSVSKDSIPK
jgi:predicted small secreted protein